MVLFFSDIHVANYDELFSVWDVLVLLESEFIPLTPLLDLLESHNGILCWETLAST